jgi:tryptophan-rich sensory protein
VVFLIQLALNLAWSVVFFGFHSMIGGLGVISFLWLFIILTMYLFAPLSRVALWLLVPYLAWVSFAFFLNLSIWFLNS